MNAIASRLLLPLSWLYGAAVAVRNRRYDRGHAPCERASVPVVSVGNLTVGGTGKTPLVAHLAEQLVAAGVRPAIVSRGYGGSAGHGPLVVSPGGGPRVDATIAGDEPVWLARRVPGALVVVGADRSAGARTAAALSAQIVLLDDGFQHRRLMRDLDLLLLDANDPFGGGRLLPAGRLREPVASVARADVVLVTRSAPGRPSPDLERAVRRHNASAPILLAGHRATGFVDASGRAVPQPKRALAFCGIGDPHAFRRDLERTGVEVVGLEAFRDHHPYRPDEIEALRERARAAGAGLVTTEKDLVRLEPQRGAAAPLDLCALRIEAFIEEGAALLDRVRRLVRGSAA